MCIWSSKGGQSHSCSTPVPRTMKIARRKQVSLKQYKWGPLKIQTGKRSKEEANDSSASCQGLKSEKVFHRKRKRLTKWSKSWNLGTGFNKPKGGKLQKGTGEACIKVSGKKKATRKRKLPTLINISKKGDMMSGIRGLRRAYGGS